MLSFSCCWWTGGEGERWQSEGKEGKERLAGRRRAGQGKGQAKAAGEQAEIEQRGGEGEPTEGSGFSLEPEKLHLSFDMWTSK